MADGSYLWFEGVHGEKLARSRLRTIGRKYEPRRLGGGFDHGDVVPAVPRHARHEPAAVNALRDEILNPATSPLALAVDYPVQGGDARSGVARGAPALRRARTPPPACRGVGGA